MFTALNTKGKLALAAILLVVGYFVAFLVRGEPPTGAKDLLVMLPRALTCAALAAAVLGHHRVIDGLWRAVPILNLIAPNLNGRFQLKNSSNWPLKNWMFDSTQGKAGPRPKNATLDVVGELRVKMGLFRLQMEYIPSERIASRSNSVVLSASFHRPVKPGSFELSYMYLATAIAPNPDTDEQHHYGCAHLSVPITCQRPDLLTGNYWTNRMWIKGLNTAGQVEALRL